MKLLLSFTVLTIVLYACQKELKVSKQANTNIASLQQFFRSNGTPIQNVKANASTYINFTTTKGNEVIFPDNAFVTLSGIPVSGDVTIEIKEIATPAEMILNNMPTISNGLPLTSGGEFFVRATQNNNSLILAPGKYIRLNLINSSADMNGMQVFNGDTANGTVNWIANTIQNNVVTRDSMSSYSSLFADSLQWINCDRFIDEPKISYSVNPGNSPNIDSTVVYVSLTGRRSVMTLRETNGFFSYDKMIASPATIISICVVNGTIYYSMIPVTMENGGSVTLDFSPIREAELKQKLSTLK